MNTELYSRPERQTSGDDSEKRARAEGTRRSAASTGETRAVPTGNTSGSPRADAWPETAARAVEFDEDRDGRSLTIVIDSRSTVTRWMPTEDSAWLGTDADGRLTALTAYGDTPDAARRALAAALERRSPDLLAVLAAIMCPDGAVRTRR